MSHRISLIASHVLVSGICLDEPPATDEPSKEWNSCKVTHILAVDETRPLLPNKTSGGKSIDRDINSLASRAQPITGRAFPKHAVSSPPAAATPASLSYALAI